MHKETFSIVTQVVARSVFINMPSTGKAVLLGVSGEQINNYWLNAFRNELKLGDIPPGIYSLRIESGTNVYVKQIILS